MCLRPTIWNCLVLSRKQFSPHVKIIQADIFFFFPSSILRWIWQTSKSFSATSETLPLAAPTTSDHTGDEWEAKRCDSGFSSHPSKHAPLFLPQTSQTNVYIPADYFQSAGATCRTEKMLVFCGKGLSSRRAWMGKWKMGRWYNWFSLCYRTHWNQYFQAHFSTFLFDDWFSYMDSLFFLTCIVKATTHNRYFSFAVKCLLLKFQNILVL